MLLASTAAAAQGLQHLAPQHPSRLCCSSMTPAGTLCLWLGCLLLCGAAPTPICDPSTCSPCSEPTPEGCCPPCAPPCTCPPYLEDDCEMQGFTDNHVPAGLSFYIDFARKLCTCQPSGDITCAPHCPSVPPTCQAVGSPVADGCPLCVCYDKEEVAVPAGTVVSRGAQLCSCPPEGGQLQCGDGVEV